MTTQSGHTLSSGDQRRVTEVQALAERGPAGAELLVQLLADPSWVVRRAVIAALVQVGTPAIPLLCQVLATRRENEAVLAAAVEALVVSRGEVDAAVIALAETTTLPPVLCDAAQILGRRKCRAAFRMLVQWSTHPDDNVAVAAIEALGRLGGPESVEPLILALASDNFFRVFPAIAVLGQTGDPRSVAPLSRLLEQSHYRAEAVAALGRTGQLSAVKPLTEMVLRNDDPLVRKVALALFDLHTRHAELSGDDGAVAAAFEAAASAAGVDASSFVRATTAADGPERLALACALAWLGNDAGVDSLISLLEGDTQTAHASFQALRRLRAGTRADVQLRAALRHGGSARRLALLPLLAGRQSAVREISACLQDADPVVRALSADALGRLGDVTAVPELFAHLGDADARVDQAVIGAVQSLGSDETKRRALSAVGSADPRVRRAALRIVSYFGYPEGLDLLLAAAFDDDERIRDAATAGLALSDDPRALQALLAGARRFDASSRAAAMRALGGTADVPVVASTLYEGLADTDPWVRYYACQSLGRLHIVGASDRVAKLLEDDAGQVRVSAVDTLARLGGDRAFFLLGEAAESSDEDVRRAAILGLGTLRRPGALPILLRALGAPDSATRLVALSAISESAAGDATLALIRARSDQDARIRDAAFSLLTQRSGVQVTTWLIEQLSHDTEREAATHALATSVEKRVEDLLLALEGADAQRARWIVHALLYFRRPAGKATVELALQLSNVHARRAAAEGLVRMGGPGATAALEEAARSDPDPDVRRICAKAG